MLYFLKDLCMTPKIFISLMMMTSGSLVVFLLYSSFFHSPPLPIDHTYPVLLCLLCFIHCTSDFLLTPSLSSYWTPDSPLCHCGPLLSLPVLLLTYTPTLCPYDPPHLPPLLLLPSSPSLYPSFSFISPFCFSPSSFPSPAFCFLSSYFLSFPYLWCFWHVFM